MVAIDEESQRVIKVPRRRILNPTIRSVLQSTRYRILLVALSLIVVYFVFAPHGYYRIIPQASFFRPIQRGNPRLSHLAVALKTGKEVALIRTPVQILSFLSGISNMILVGEAPGVSVGNLEMVDVYTGLYDPPPTNIERTNLLTSALPIPENEDHKRGLSKRQEIVPDESSDGWKADAHKNMPGFRTLWEKFPDAKWYIMLDDDTYLYVSNLDQFLGGYDHEEAWYFGSSNMFQGCDNVHRFGDGPGFAHGGSGIVISRGAMKKMMPVLDTCIHKYKDCWAGDIRLALCLRDVGVYITDPGGFNKHPPHDDHSFPGDACKLPITFHHLLVDQIQTLYSHQLKVEARNESVDYGAVFRDWNAKGSGLIKVGNRQGQDYKNFASKSADACMNSCQEDIKCAAFAFDQDTCWLKSGVPSLDTDFKDILTGYIANHYVCSKPAKLNFH